MTLTPVTDADQNVVAHCGLDLYADQGNYTIYCQIMSHVKKFELQSSLSLETSFNLHSHLLICVD